MLIDNNGREMRADKLPKHGKAREIALSVLREVPRVHIQKGGMFSLGTRAKLTEHIK